jgi:hypothetical protein
VQNACPEGDNPSGQAGGMGRNAAVLDTLREEKLNVVDFLHNLLPHLVFRQII